jgi:hypothetical protein
MPFMSCTARHKHEPHQMADHQTWSCMLRSLLPSQPHSTRLPCDGYCARARGTNAPASCTHQVQVIKLHAVRVGSSGVHRHFHTVHPFRVLFNHVLDDLWVPAPTPCHANTCARAHRMTCNLSCAERSRGDAHQLSRCHLRGSGTFVAAASNTHF